MQDVPPVEIHQAIEAPTLVLYYFPECPYCFRVLEAIKAADIDVELRNTRQNPDDRQFLLDTVGKTQVPCLFIDGNPMHESTDIIHYLQSI